MADIVLPPNVRQDPNTGLYLITNAQGKTVRVNADTQEQLNQYVNSVNTGVPATVTTTDPNTGNPRTRTFDSTAMIAQQESVANQQQLLTDGKRKAGVIGNRDGSYQDLRTGQTISKDEAEAKIKSAGLPPETLAAVTPKDSPAYAAAQQSINQTATAPSNIPPADALQPSQSEGGNSTSAEVTKSVVSPPANTETPATNAPNQVPVQQSLSPGEELVNTSAPAPQPGTGFGEGNAEDLALFPTTAPATVLPSGTGFGEGNAEDLALFPTTAPAAVLPSGTGFGEGTAEDLALFASVPPTEDRANSTKQAAQDQRTLQQRYKQPGNQDWRVRLVLAEGATYLYKDTSNTLLKPLANSNGVIFPYTPAISTSYVANYDKYDLVHNNYRGYFYKNSAVNDVNITGTFTAQDTAEAQYLLAVIHFFRSATKMFYGKDPERGAPPPLVYLVGYGEWQFNGHPCLITNFNYNLPADVDYIRASAPNNYGENLLNRRNPTSGSSSFSQGAVATRLLNALLPKGAIPQNVKPNPNPTGTGTVNNTQRPTYVPTKMEIAITLLPVNTRSQVSQQFELKKFANGDLLKEGFW